jgi:hypothetical protein
METKWVTVKGTLIDGVTIGMGDEETAENITAIYEAAAKQEGLVYDDEDNKGKGQLPGAAFTFFGIQKFSSVHLPGVGSIADKAIATGGSVNGAPVVAAAPPSWMWGSNDKDADGFHIVDATTAPGTSAIPVQISIAFNHVYEVVDVKNGMIGIRNPWGNNGGDYFNGNVFYISKDDFDKTFAEVAWATSPLGRIKGGK